MDGGAQTLCERPYSIAAVQNPADFILATRFRSASRHVTNWLWSNIGGHQYD
jgi:hypothetical protein